LRRCPAIDQGEKALLAGIDQYCWHGVRIPEDADGPPFSYSDDLGLDGCGQGL